MTDGYVRALKERTVQEVIRTLRRRVDELGVAEPVISPQGANNDQITIFAPAQQQVTAHRRSSSG